MFHAERRTDMTKLIVAFSNFTKAPKKENSLLRFYGDNGYSNVTQCNVIRKLFRTNDTAAHTKQECTACGNTSSTLTHIEELKDSLTLDHSEGGILLRSTSTAQSNSVRH
jgi:hypothetical protein